LSPAQASSRQSIETLATQQALPNLPSDPGLSMQIGTTNTPENFWEGKISHNKANQKLQNTTGKLAGFFLCVLHIFKLKNAIPTFA
jgi:hypothetical protein